MGKPTRPPAERQLSNHLCECGCGQFTYLADRPRGAKKSGHPLRCLRGHRIGATKQFHVEFWKKVNIYGANGCWEWEAAVNHAGYGELRTKSMGGFMLAHRASWELANGPIPEGMCVLHRCDNPACVRPDHLFLGNRADNNRDSASKGRNRLQRHPEATQGSRHPMHHLVESDVVDMRRRRANGEQVQSLAAEYGISKTHAGSIINGHSWKCVPLEEST